VNGKKGVESTYPERGRQSTSLPSTTRQKEEPGSENPGGAVKRYPGKKILGGKAPRSEVATCFLARPKRRRQAHKQKKDSEKKEDKKKEQRSSRAGLTYPRHDRILPQGRETWTSEARGPCGTQAPEAAQKGENSKSTSRRERAGPRTFASEESSGQPGAFARASAAKEQTNGPETRLNRGEKGTPHPRPPEIHVVTSPAMETRRQRN